jgi:serine phosphatase RsbU (regulator of sigma subunit)
MTMSENSLNAVYLKWSQVFYSPDNNYSNDIIPKKEDLRKNIIEKIARSLYEDLRKQKEHFQSPLPFNKPFQELDDTGKDQWFAFISEIPSKLKILNLYIRPFENFCRTCIITHSDIEKLAEVDYDTLRNNIIYDKSSPQSLPVSFKTLSEKKKRFFRELNYLLPAQLKKAGFEIIRPEEIAEIDERMIKKIARAIHSRYMYEIRKQQSNSESSGEGMKSGNYSGDKNGDIAEFDNLPDDIKFSNIDNAYHIPTKLLAVGFKIRHVKKGHKPVTLHLSSKEIETMSEIEHLRWSWDKRLNGWTYGETKDSTRKIHPGLIPYNELPELEKEKDRELVRLIPALLRDINFEAYPVNPNRLKKLSYLIKPQSSIHRILDETRELNDQLRKLAVITPQMEEMIRIRNNKIEEAIKEIEGSYNYAKHIQDTFLPDDLFIRECFPDSFILYIPKDIVSGDFYFFSRQENVIIFAVADCTGHGIPGALLSSICYGTLDQAVNRLRLAKPHEILHHLFSRIHRFLKVDIEDQGLPDDMDIALCSLDINTNLLNYSGVSNPIFRVSGGELIEYKAGTSRPNCGENGDCLFSSEAIQLKRGDSIYLLSDGYTDQFGGKNHKKYQTHRFKSFLTSMQEYSMPEQNDLMYEEIERWKEENNEDQTDDILVVGIRI